ncbi:Sugar diacid utilization transcriptional regulator [Mannheimia sp. USDA-ARS-USMARC-1261]|uniref:CdaR family transcriptional regulator n=1 Tax=Mannheimia sp. USDA-ARS-USMARC-1261 TaxID=1432056 RepID=UPI0003E3EB95|nr:sugar diacid recognition domain-containing protein [Mannheimia sp. USDA-ARS-USMARC-1261]AHG72276.1 Sugar diacid utilization transcriptional regulator [Mannheimia sp. USDA-ARS-USMARC-1261]
MKLNRAIADRIVKRTMQIIPNSVNVMDNEGVIIASGDTTRIGQRHTGAVLALRQDQAVEIDENLAKQWHYEAKAGINLPLHYLGSTVGVVGISGQPQDIRQYAQLVKMAAELIMQQAFELEQERWQRRYREEFVRALLKGTLSTEEIHEQAVFFEQDFAKPLSVILIKVNTPTAEKLQHLIDFFEHHFPALLTAVISLDKIALLNNLSNDKSLIRNTLNKLTDPEISFKTVVGLSVENLSQTNISYQTARYTLNYAEQIQSRKRIIYFEDFKLPALLHSFSHSWEAKTLLVPFQALLNSDKKQVLLKSLRHYFFANCDLDHAAQKLFIHPNTLRYRLEKIEQITGLSFNNIEQKFVLYLGAVLS